MSELALVHVAYQAIHQKLLNGTYVPGMLLSESELSGELGMSRTPVRAAVSLLEKEGFVRTLKKKGILVQGIEVGELFDIYDLLLALYSFALDQIDEHQYELDLEALRGHLGDMLEASDNKLNREYYECGLKFMKTLLLAIDNRSILETFDRYKDKMLFFVVAYRSTKGSNRPYTGRKLYAELLDLLTEKNYSEAKKFLKQYKLGSQEELLRHSQSLTLT
ncbi:GntR family transcriptional regulator [Cohnella thailandensis]|uniref:GntR family transcriptional regulator n=1 Tax=Cohnella thailandensis TaxID=557557 RepID=A0A841SMI4_9BACL|nr:GntR family transcriptional regulator [Cohnella thailandensis]MBB6633144.1 GntR family transcriptional regulator [Cohnella thailandensis]MBP1975160.1 DNA-binding GntR family transcriptional regulator [Cohnella thailandensis]